jgi:hypothetical protein
MLQACGSGCAFCWQAIVVEKRSKSVPCMTIELERVEDSVGVG